MIKFEKDNYIMYFENADEAVAWLIEQHINGGTFDLITEYNDEFSSWVNDNYCVTDLLEDPEYYTRDYFSQEWRNYLAVQVLWCYDEFEVEEE